MQLEHPEFVSAEAGGAMGNSEPAGRLEVEEDEDGEGDKEEEGCGSRENSPERTRQSCSEAVTDALLPKQHPSTQEGESLQDQRSCPWL